jgi:ABC-type multidrug transport system ATPase subunit
MIEEIPYAIKDNLTIGVANSIDICFRDISYTVQIEDNSQHQSLLPCMKTFKDKTLIDNVSGIMKSGKLTAIMGASGAGKTTLLNILACRVKQKMMSGSVTANGIPYSFDNFGDFANYVMQQDVLIQTLTVRETLEFAANLKLDLSQEDKKKRIMTLIRKFKL